MYIVYNDGWLSETPDAVKSINTMATKSLFYNNKKSFNVSTNCDGAILLQLCMQYLKSPVFDDYFADVLSNTTSRIRSQTSSEVLKVVLIGNYLSAFIYSAEATFRYLEQEGILEPVFEELFTCDSKMFHSYQRKLYLIGLGQSLFSEYIPEVISQNIIKIISKMILMLGRLNLTEKYTEKKHQLMQEKEGHGRKIPKNVDFMNSISDGEDEKIEDELKEINEYCILPLTTFRSQFVCFKTISF